MDSSTKALIRTFTEKVGRYPEEERKQILSALRWAEGLHRDQLRASGEPFLIHPLSVADILVDAHLDYQTVIAAVLHDALEDTGLSSRELRKEYGREVEALVQGVTKISVIRGRSKTTQAAASIRKMLFAMVKDIRVIMIKLADKLHNMRTLEYLDAKSQKRIADECLEIYAPLAGRLGMSRIKSELEDLSLRVLHPRAYEQIDHFVQENKEDLHEFLRSMEASIRGEAEKAGVPIEIESRIKHYYSMYRKIKKKGRMVDEIYDQAGMRLICETTSQCYELLGLLHSLWKPIEGRFKDYIAMPKSNLYQSLHTTVMGPGGKMLEIQIRTGQMHRTAEEGIAAHWLYKRELIGERIKPEQLTIINMLKSWDSSNVSSPDFLEEIKRELLRDSIYVFTPQGDIIELTRGSTALDFAYHIHTDIGNHCMAAKADGNLIRLNEELKNTQVIEILTAPSAHPHINWLRMVRSTRSRSKIRHWLVQNEPGLIIDRNIVAKKKAGGPAGGKEGKAGAQIRSGTASAAPETRPPRRPGRRWRDRMESETQVRDASRVGIRIGEERNMMIRLARCCNPAAGDPIVGYISRGRGIIVHRADCPNLKNIKEFEERHLEVEWETVSPKATRRFEVTARKTTNLFSEVEGAIKKYHGHLIEGKLDENIPETLQGFFTVELDNGRDFEPVLKSLRTIPSVL
ncbi:MAG: bifunctional (p)ppGpp synthetase/guanosine-3',5'-bis(diphosphate) 3'-pyrophosphohydrolase, partial [Spirochaetales bacterium]|nr:bifunctional (p)ppGpp synthetase/guanosine-3',5'-bis(diphosphate) 3'-pyrophosphohydrolase [Spirochaetales bacterium]